MLKTLASNQSSVGFVKGIADGNVIYQVTTYQGATISSKTYSMKADGTAETELQGFLYTPNIIES